VRRFRLIRDEDETGVSGTGRVAEGIEFSDGAVALRWRGPVASLIVHSSMAAVEQVHLHGGMTRVAWLDPPVVLGADPSPLARGMEHYMLDRMENVPFASIGGLPARMAPIRPECVPVDEWPMYLFGYLTAAREDAGAEWATASWGWAPALVIPGGGRSGGMS